MRACPYALAYVGVFFITARREWVGIDRHRMDKYLLLVWPGCDIHTRAPYR
jgi:hypothetical protein